MAIQLSNTYATSEGLEVNAPFAFLYFDLGRENYVRIKYYKDKLAFNDGKDAINLVGVPTILPLVFTSEEFFGAAIINQVHEHIISIMYDGTIVTNITDGEQTN